VVRDGKGAKFLTTPVSAAGENLRAIEQTIDLATEGAATMQHRITVQGASAGAVRFRFQSPEQRKERATDMLGSLYPGAAVQDVETPGIGNIKQPAQLSAKIRAPNFGTIDGDRLRFPVLGRGSSMMQGLAGLAERKHDLMLDVPSTETYHLRYDLPRGHRFSRVPSAAKIATELGTFELKIATTPDGAEVHSRLQLLRHRIEPSEYRAFREFLRRVDATLEQTFEVAPAR
jgi:hypothetical protein